MFGKENIAGKVESKKLRLQRGNRTVPGYPHNRSASSLALISQLSHNNLAISRVFM